MLAAGWGAEASQGETEPLGTPKDLLVHFLRPCLPSQGMAVPWKLGSKQTWPPCL